MRAAGGASADGRAAELTRSSTYSSVIGSSQQAMTNVKGKMSEIASERISKTCTNQCGRLDRNQSPIPTIAAPIDKSSHTKKRLCRSPKHPVGQIRFRNRCPASKFPGRRKASDAAARRRSFQIGSSRTLRLSVLAREIFPKGRGPRCGIRRRSRPASSQETARTREAVPWHPGR